MRSAQDGQQDLPATVETISNCPMERALGAAKQPLTVFGEEIRSVAGIRATPIPLRKP
jgi:hypothetical protein